MVSSLKSLEIFGYILFVFTSDNIMALSVNIFISRTNADKLATIVL